MAKKENEKGNSGFLNKIKNTFGGGKSSGPDVEDNGGEDVKVKPTHKPHNSFSKMLEERKAKNAERNKTITANAKKAMAEKKAFETKLSDNAKRAGESKE